MLKKVKLVSAFMIAALFAGNTYSGLPKPEYTWYCTKCAKNCKCEKQIITKSQLEEAKLGKAKKEKAIEKKLEQLNHLFSQIISQLINPDKKTPKIATIPVLSTKQNLNEPVIQQKRTHRKKTGIYTLKNYK